MRWLLDRTEDSRVVAEVIRAAGGKVIGRTRLQKMFYLLEAAGLTVDFAFEYRHYGPYSEELSRATSIACVYGLVTEEEHRATWGGTYSIFTASGEANAEAYTAYVALLELANHANPIELELAATAFFLSVEGFNDAWEETVRRKPEKAQRLEGAKKLVRELHQLHLPKKLPVI